MKPLPHTPDGHARARAIDNRFDQAIRKAEQDGPPFSANLPHNEGVVLAYVAGLRAGRKLPH